MDHLLGYPSPPPSPARGEERTVSVVGTIASTAPPGSSPRHEAVTPRNDRPTRSELPS